MILSNQQALYLFSILQDSLTISDGGDSPFTYSQQARVSLYQTISMQQDDKKHDLEALAKPIKEPRYDDVYKEGVKWLDEL